MSSKPTVGKAALVCGAGGFIGHHLVKRLKREGFWVRGADLKFPRFSETEADDFMIGDLRDPYLVRHVLDRRFDEIYQLAADMGGAGYIFTGEHDADLMHNSASINLNILQGAYSRNNKRIFYSLPPVCTLSTTSSTPIIRTAQVGRLSAAPDSEYGWEKLFSERLYPPMAVIMADVRIAATTIYSGPRGAGTTAGKRHRRRCRKVAMASNGERRQIWGDGKQTRSFLYIDECLEGTLRLMRSDFSGPVNIGSDEMVTIDGLVDMVAGIASKSLKKRHIDGPTGVRGRNSDNRLISDKLKWSPSTVLVDGLRPTYAWISRQVMRNSRSEGETVPVVAAPSKARSLSAVQ
jgi:nucleoside-diphosphate-sugar epimerase